MRLQAKTILLGYFLICGIMVLTVNSAPRIGSPSCLFVSKPIESSSNVVNSLMLDVREVESTPEVRNLSIHFDFSVTDFVSFSLFMNQTLLGFDIVNSTSFTKNWYVSLTQPGIVNISVILFAFNGSSIFQNQVLYELKPLVNSILPQPPTFLLILSAIGIGAMVYLPVQITRQRRQRRKNANLFLTTSDISPNTKFDMKGRKNSYFRNTFEDTSLPFQIRLNYLLTCANIVSFQLYNNVTNELILQFQTKRHLFNQINSVQYSELMTTLQSAPHAKKDAWEIPLQQERLVLKKWDCEYLSVAVFFMEPSDYNSSLFQKGIKLYFARSLSVVPVTAATASIPKEKLIMNLHEIFNISLAFPMQLAPDSPSDIKFKKKLLNEFFHASTLPNYLRPEIEQDIENLTIGEIKTLLVRLQNDRQLTAGQEQNFIDDEITQENPKNYN